MDFEAWLQHIGKSPSTAKKYSGAISGTITDWAKAASLTNHSLLSIQTPTELAVISVALKATVMFQASNTKGNSMYSSALNAYYEYLVDTSPEDINNDITAVMNDVNISVTEKSTLVSARVGQGRFRQQLIEKWQGCAATGFKDTRFLVASHIKPWKVSDNNQRLDPYNGLLLIPNLDKVFDLGFVSFDLYGKLMISGAVEDLTLLGVKPDITIRLEMQHQAYMEYHRDKVFVK